MSPTQRITALEGELAEFREEVRQSMSTILGAVDSINKRVDTHAEQEPEWVPVELDEVQHGDMVPFGSGENIVRYQVIGAEYGESVSFGITLTWDEYLKSATNGVYRQQ